MSRASHISQSSARPSTLNSGPQGSSSGQARLQAKRQELEGLQILKDQSARLAKDVENLSQGVDQLADVGETVANVMASWAGVFRAIQVARSSATLPSVEDDPELQAHTVRAIPETMVRLPVDTASTESTLGEIDKDAP